MLLLGRSCLLPAGVIRRLALGGEAPSAASRFPTNVPPSCQYQARQAAMTVSAAISLCAYHAMACD